MVAGVEVWPVRTNAAFLLACLERPHFRTGDVNTGFIAAHEAELTAAEPATDRGGMPRLPLFAPISITRRMRPRIRGRRKWGSASMRPSALPSRSDSGGEERTIDLNASRTSKRWSSRPRRGAGVPRGPGVRILAVSRGTGTSHGLHDGEIEAPMPGKITAVEVSAGEKVAKGQRLLTLEAMKMEHALTAPFDGTVAELSATAGAQVTEGQFLVRVNQPRADGFLSPCVDSFSSSRFSSPPAPRARSRPAARRWRSSCTNGQTIGTVRAWQTAGGVTFRFNATRPAAWRSRHPRPLRRPLRSAGLHQRWARTGIRQPKHGTGNPAGPHAGDLPNVEVSANGVLGHAVRLPAQA